MNADADTVQYGATPPTVALVERLYFSPSADTAERGFFFRPKGKKHSIEILGGRGLDNEQWQRVLWRPNYLEMKHPQLWYNLA